MFSVFVKEISSFFNSVIAYLVIGVFLILLGIVVWVVPPSIFDSGLATLQTLFFWAPFVLLFLVPAITMKSIAEERKSGTLELLLTRPIGNLQLILGKFLACLALVILSLLPTIVYYYSLTQLANPVGNVDGAAVFGSYIGLILLSAAYVAIGVFSSSVTSNQIVAFILSVSVSVIFYFGFDAIANVDLWSSNAFTFRQIGMSFHYEALSRGVLDTRNLIYFLSITGLFIGGSVAFIRHWAGRIPLTKVVLGKYAAATLVVIGLNFFLTDHFGRIDFTSDGRYSLSESTETLLDKLDGQITVEVYLTGNLPAHFQQIEKAVKEKLTDMRSYAGSDFIYEFVDIATLEDSAKAEVLKRLARSGIEGENLEDQNDGKITYRTVYPAAILSYRSKQMAIRVTDTKQVGNTNVVNIQQSINEVEYELDMAIKQLMVEQPKNVAFVQGHDELVPLELEQIFLTLSRFYNIGWLELNSIQTYDQIANVDIMIIAQPKRAFSEDDKLKLDQYIMNGGKVLFFLDAIQTKTDSTGMVGLALEHGLDDLLFRYGVRINQEAIRDLQAAPRPVQIGNNYKLKPWPFTPIISNWNKEHPISKNLGTALAREVSTIDTIKSPGVKKTPLAFTSQYTAVTGGVLNYSTADINMADATNLDPYKYPQKNIPVAYLLEGSFTSLYRNRPLPNYLPRSKFKESITHNKIFVCSDGNLPGSEIDTVVNRSYPLGLDRYSKRIHGNAQFIQNAIDYMLDEDGVFSLRAKDLDLRLLDPTKIDENSERQKWQMINIVIPLSLLLLFGVARYFLRRRKYSGF